MKRSAVIIFILALVALPFALSQEKKDEGVELPKFYRGGKPTPFPKIVEALKSGKAGIYRAAAAPEQVIVVPKRLSMWGNSQYGVCVTSESCFAISAYSTYSGFEQIFVTEATAIKWAKDRNYLNGAYLLEVIEDMQKDGIKDENNFVRKAGKASTVDYSNEETLKSAIAQGPVSIAIGASSLPSGAGDKNGWSISGSKRSGADHCVSLCGYGSSSELFKALQVSAPSSFPANGYLLFTWNTIGVVDHKWLMSTCVEAWVRNPTVIDLPEPPDPPQPNKIEVKVANVSGGVGAPVKFSPNASGGTSPYIFLFEYGDGVQDASGSHSYSQAGSYKVTVTAVDSKGRIGTGTCTATIGSTPPPPPIPGPGGYQFIIPQDIPAGTYYAVDPVDLAEIQRRLDLITGKLNKKKEK